MTLMLIEDTLSEEEQIERLSNPSVKCSWCGEIIKLEGEELALAICPACYAHMLAEYERALQVHHADPIASDR